MNELSQPPKDTSQSCVFDFPDRPTRPVPPIDPFNPYNPLLDYPYEPVLDIPPYPPIISPDPPVPGIDPIPGSDPHPYLFKSKHIFNIDLTAFLANSNFVDIPGFGLHDMSFVDIEFAHIPQSGGLWHGIETKTGPGPHTFAHISINNTGIERYLFWIHYQWNIQSSSLYGNRLRVWYLPLEFTTDDNGTIYPWFHAQANGITKPDWFPFTTTEEFVSFPSYPPDPIAPDGHITGNPFTSGPYPVGACILSVRNDRDTEVSWNANADWYP